MAFEVTSVLSTDFAQNQSAHVWVGLVNGNFSTINNELHSMFMAKTKHGRIPGSVPGVRWCYNTPTVGKAQLAVFMVPTAHSPLENELPNICTHGAATADPSDALTNSTPYPAGVTIDEMSSDGSIADNVANTTLDNLKAQVRVVKFGYVDLPQHGYTPGAVLYSDRNDQITYVTGSDPDINGRIVISPEMRDVTGAFQAYSNRLVVGRVVDEDTIYIHCTAYNGPYIP